MSQQQDLDKGRCSSTEPGSSQNPAVARFTPGPWSIEQHGERVWITANRINFSGKPSVKAVRGMKPEKVAITNFAAGGMPLAEALANASLIAASPDLYAALARLVARYHPYRDNQGDSDWASSVAALAKARPTP